MICPYCHAEVQRVGEDAIDWCPEHGVLEGDPEHQVGHASIRQLLDSLGFAISIDEEEAVLGRRATQYVVCTRGRTGWWCSVQDGFQRITSLDGLARYVASATPEDGAEPTHEPADALGRKGNAFCSYCGLVFVPLRR
jgi:hypothetical protein